MLGLELKFEKSVFDGPQEPKRLVFEVHELFHLSFVTSKLSDICTRPSSLLLLLKILLRSENQIESLYLFVLVVVHAFEVLVGDGLDLSHDFVSLVPGLVNFLLENL